MAEEKTNKTNETIKSQPLETVEPIGKRILIRKDEDKKRPKAASNYRTTSRYQQ